MSAVITTNRLIIKAVQPFDFNLSSRIFSNGDRQIGGYAKGSFWRVIRISDKLVLVTVESSGTVSIPRLSCTLSSDRNLTETDLNKARRIITVLFNLRLDLKPFYQEMHCDHVMEQIIRRLKGLRSPSTPTVYEALVESIIEQQISLTVAIAMEHKLIKSFGDSLSIDKEIYFAFPTPEKLALVAVDELRRVGLSSRKAEYIREISKLIVEGELNLEEFKTFDDTQQIVQNLDKVRGVGVWTAELTVIRSMQKFDAIPADDLGLRRTISHYYCNDEEISSEETRRIAGNWGRWRGLAAFYLIIAKDIGIKI